MEKVEIVEYSFKRTEDIVDEVDFDNEFISGHLVLNKNNIKFLIFNFKQLFIG